MGKRKSKKVELPPEPKKSGRPEIEIDLEQLKVFCRLKPSLEDCAAFYKCSSDTIERRIREATGLPFAVFRDQSMVHTRFELVRKAIQKANNGDNDMHKFCLKNLCGWGERGDQHPVAVNVINNFTSLTDEQIDQKLSELENKHGQGE
jgi:hypothetical protein